MQHELPRQEKNHLLFTSAALCSDTDPPTDSVGGSDTSDGKCISRLLSRSVLRLRLWIAGAESGDAVAAAFQFCLARNKGAALGGGSLGLGLAFLASADLMPQPVLPGGTSATAGSKPLFRALGRLMGLGALYLGAGLALRYRPRPRVKRPVVGASRAS